MTTLSSLVVLITATLPRYFCLPIVIPAQAGIHAYRDVGGRAASGTSGRGGRGRAVKGRQVWPDACLRLAPLLSFPQGGHG